MIRQLVNQAMKYADEQKALRIKQDKTELKIAKLLGVKEARVLMDNLISVSENLPSMDSVVINDDDGKPFLYCYTQIDGIKIMYTEDCE